MSSELTSLTIAQIAPELQQREVSPVELTRACLERISELDTALNAFITVLSDSALEQAHTAEREIAGGKYRGPLHGIPVAVKDLIDIRGVRTTAGSRVFANRVATRDAEVIRRLREAGAVIVGKTNLHEFAYGGSGIISAFGPCRNPREPKHIAGGSSSGSAAAVAAGMCFAAIGTDTAGSVREPAALCGIVGLEPTHGLVSADGVVPLSESLDVVGPMTRTVEDAHIVLNAISDARTMNSPATATEPRIGLARQFFFEDLDPAVESAIQSAINLLGETGDVLDISIPVDTDRTLQKGESYHFHKEFVASCPELYDPETLRRIRTGEDVSLDDLNRLRSELREFRQRSLSVFQQVDFVVTPTTPMSAPELDPLLNNDQLRTVELVLLRNTRPFNVLGWPAITIPCGTSRDGLPIGIQIAARPYAEESLLSFAGIVEKLFAEAVLRIF